MKKMVRIIAVAALIVSAATTAMATPATQIWIPSTDIRDFKQVHVDMDNYVKTKPSQGLNTNTYDIGLGVGVLPFEKVKMEVGIDHIVNGTSYDNYPLYFNAKVGTSEGTLFKMSPALAVGGFGFGTKDKLTNQNVIYGLAAETIPVLGRISAGYYTGNKDVLLNVDTNKKDNSGVLLSLDRTISEISDKLWAAVDFQGGKNSLGALNFGVAWSFTPTISLIVGYDIYNAKSLQDTFTTQLDINF